ncbi:MAG TPA: amidase [Pyrinomonadaceae bacterium]|jgi:Asp-tRNA(Asn)/Glu-tRNA(Gln) amidotransferase A subunit family amidase|nr:amidase [Pyrinomonadaceae bacterium]
MFIVHQFPNSKRQKRNANIPLLRIAIYNAFAINIVLLTSKPSRWPQLSEELTTKSATELIALMHAREVSPLDVVEAHLRAIERINPTINAIVTIAGDLHERAVEAENAIMRGSAVGLLQGLPITIKDTIDTAGLRTTSGSRIRARYVPQQDAPAVARLKAAGAIVLGKTNVPEMAIPYECDNPVFGRTNNPHKVECTAGGSSGGEAAAIAAHVSPAGIGSDLSGSIRVPAHFCGITGLKPTVGCVPMEGHTPSASGVVGLGASIGPMARHVKDVALLFRVLANSGDLEMSPKEILDAKRVSGARVAWYTEDGTTPVSGEIKQKVQSAALALADAGLQTFEALPPGVSKAPQLWMDLFSRAANSEIVLLYRGREDEAGPLVSRLLRSQNEEPNEFEDRIDTAEKLAHAVVERERLREDLLRWMKTTPLILAPVGATATFEHGRQRVDIDGTYASVFSAFSYSQAFNVFGFPSVTVPAGKTSSGLPIGVQVIGRPFEEFTMLAAASIIEQAFGGWQPPALPEAG